jgi:hypothetical protein
VVVDAGSLALQGGEDVTGIRREAPVAIIDYIYICARHGAYYGTLALV